VCDEVWDEVPAAPIHATPHFVAFFVARVVAYASSQDFVETALGHPYSTQKGFCAHGICPAELVCKGQGEPAGALRQLPTPNAYHLPSTTFLVVRIGVEALPVTPLPPRRVRRPRPTTFVLFVRFAVEAILVTPMPLRRVRRPRPTTFVLFVRFVHNLHVTPSMIRGAAARRARP
jgi:hypothetical protein